MFGAVGRFIGHGLAAPPGAVFVQSSEGIHAGFIARARPLQAALPLRADMHQAASGGLRLPHSRLHLAHSQANTCGSPGTFITRATWSWPIGCSQSKQGVPGLAADEVPARLRRLVTAVLAAYFRHHSFSKKNGRRRFPRTRAAQFIHSALSKACRPPNPGLSWRVPVPGLGGAQGTQALYLRSRLRATGICEKLPGALKGSACTIAG